MPFLRSPWFACGLLVLACLLAWRIATHEPRWGPGVVVRSTPQQSSPTGPGSWQADGYRYQALADFSLQARVLSRKDYTDRQSAISPMDLALGWGVMSDQSVLDRLSISQSGRWYRYRWSDKPPASPGDIIRSSANMHIIPGSPEVASHLAGAKAGGWVDLRGRLVRVDGPGQWRWVSSLSRSDTGNGACELFWVEQAIVLDVPPG